MNGQVITLLPAVRRPRDTSAPTPRLFGATLAPAHPADVAATLFLVWLGSSPVWLLASALFGR